MCPRGLPGPSNAFLVSLGASYCTLEGSQEKALQGLCGELDYTGMYWVL